MIDFKKNVTDYLECLSSPSKLKAYLTDLYTSEKARINIIVAIIASTSHSLGLRSDGTVIAVGNNGYGQCNVSDWKLF